MKKIKVMTIFGTRPEAIKMAPVVTLLKHDKNFKSITVVTAQHRQMLDQVLNVFKIKPDYDLNIMQKGQTLSDISSKILNVLDGIIKNEQPDIILVHGDTTSAFIASLSAFYNKVSIGHVEAGLRTWDKFSPYPEEMNRQMIDDLSDLYFAPTQKSKQNLIKQNHKHHIFITGNTAIDALKKTVSPIKESNSKRLILLTMHRRENQGDTMKNIFKTIKETILKYPDTELVYPVHLSPNVQRVAHEIFDNIPQIHLIEPLDVIDFHNLIAKSYFIMTDSGGIQEEGPALKKPVLVLRNTTERPEGIASGTLKLVGTNTKEIKRAMHQLLDNKDEYLKMSLAKNPYGDGQASKRILEAIRYYFKQTDIPPKEFNSTIN